MNRNLMIKLFAFMMFAAALLGCGGPGNDTVVVPQVDAEVPDHADAQPQPDVDAGQTDVDSAPEASNEADACPDKKGDPCTTPGQPSTCGKLICDCDNKLVADDGTVMSPCIEDSGPKDADAGVDAETGVETGTDADAQVEAEADVQAEPDADAQAEAEVGQDADAGVDAETGVETGTDADAGVIDVIPPQEICGNGIDDDGNNLTDCQDPACASYISCQPEVCDGADNNGNGIVDVDNPAFACVGTPNNIHPCTFMCNGTGLPGYQACNTSTCQWDSCVKGFIVEAHCADGIDNDCNGFTDCQDPDCASYIACKPEICNNGVDDNGNSKADCDDPACVNSPYCKCYPPQVGSDCAHVGEFSCDPTIRCDCTWIWRLASTPGVFNCMITEVCNGLDDNNNGQADEAFVCVQHHTTQCMTSCNSIGSQYCKDDCTLDVCQPPAEDCNNAKDDDCDGKTDCSDPDCINAANCQVPELCDGLDNNNNGFIDEHQPCVFNSVQSCTTSCGSTSQQKCIKDPIYDVNCKWDACQPANKDLNCTDGKDDDCDGWTDCFDPDCWGTATCPHDFGTCSTLTPTNVPGTCGTWSKEDAPAGVDRIFSCCANAENDQWCLGGNYTNLMLIHKTSSWNLVPLPVAGGANLGGGHIACLGSNQFYMAYINENPAYHYNGVLARWDGNSVIRLGASELSGVGLGPMMAFSPTDIRLVGYDSPTFMNARIIKWDGTAFETLPLPAYMPPMRLWAADLWGANNQGMYLVGSLSHDSQNSVTESILLHFDGTSWARIQTSAYGLTSVHGTTSCDAIVTGSIKVGSAWQGLTMHRNGNSWVTTVHPQVEGIGRVVKTDVFKYLLLGSDTTGDPFTTARVGTSDGDFTATWSTPMQDFEDAYALFRIPGTSKVSLGGSGFGGWILEATCQ